MSKCGVFSGPYFPIFELNSEIYSVNLRIQFEYGKIRTRKNSVFGHFSHCSHLHMSRSFYWGSFWFQNVSLNICAPGRGFIRAIAASIYLWKVNNRNTRERRKICSKLTIKTPERPQ